MSRYCLLVLHENEFISLSRLEDGFSASLEAKGRTVLAYPSSTPLIVMSAAKVVPKGLRPFGAVDSEFFLDLLPGVPDGRGLPQSIAYWKDRIEDAVPGKSFRVGIIYGPSGCGKSSMIKAGLLPNSADHILTVYIEAAGDKTETLILEGLRESCHGALGSGLVETIAALETGSGIPDGKSKVLIIIDQFEQWLHAHRSGDGRELFYSLKTCKGSKSSSSHSGSRRLLHGIDPIHGRTRGRDAAGLELGDHGPLRGPSCEKGVEALRPGIRRFADRRREA